jgi:ABC-type dipeptide/oligopeptide/nickel transport system permease component
MFIGRRIVGTLPSLLGVVVVTFLLSHALPGDPAAYFAGPAANADSIASVRASLGLDRSLPEQFLHYVLDLLHGNLGNSLTTGQPVLVDLAQRLPASLELSAFAIIFAVGVAVPLGVWSATKVDGPVDHASRVLVTVSAAFPTFFAGLLLVYVFYYLLDWAPEPVGRLNEINYSPPPTITGAYTVDALLARDWSVFRAALAQLTLPAISLGLFAMAPLARITRAAMLEALGSDFVRTARASGLPTTKRTPPHHQCVGNGLFLLDGIQRADRASIRLARRWRLRRVRRAGLRLRGRTGLRPHDGDPLRALESRGRHRGDDDRSARALRVVRGA